MSHERSGDRTTHKCMADENTRIEVLFYGCQLKRSEHVEIKIYHEYRRTK